MSKLRAAVAARKATAPAPPTKPTAAAAPATPPKPKPAAPKPPRLPPGSAYACSWDGVRWTATLTVPGAPPFTLERSTLFACLAKVDQAYRRWLAERPPPAS